MSDGNPSRRLFSMAFLIAVAFVGLGYRLVELQVVDHEKYRLESERLTHHLLVRVAKRGDIRDVRGNLLAGSLLVKTVCGNPAIIGEHRVEVAHLIAPILGLSEEEVVQRLEPRVFAGGEHKGETNQYVVLKKSVPIETCQQIQEALKQLPLGRACTNKHEKAEYWAIQKAGIGTDQIDGQIRVYPNQSLAAHVLGFVGDGENDGPTGKYSEIQGKYGIEWALDAALKGVAGWKDAEFGKMGEVVAFREQDVPARPGRNVFLTIDAGVQHILETELAKAMEKHTPISASGLVIRPRTGEILAMATLPNFDPNNAGASPMDSLRNRLIADEVEPGSTFKVVVVSGALNDGVVTLDEQFFCENGIFRYMGVPLKDVEPHGLLSVRDIIVHSSNIGAAKIGLKMGPERLYHYMRAFGFGVRTGIELSGERTGTVHPINRWSKISITRIPMGHEVGVTPLQMAMAISAVANGGRLMRPLLVDRLEDDQGHVIFRNYPQVVRQAVSEQAAHLMVKALEAVVTTNGTGKNAVIAHYTVAGKTGTAQKLINHSYRNNHHFSSFIGFLPAEAPEICVAVFLDDPKRGYYAAEAAAPVFHDVAERVVQYLAVPADRPDPAPAPLPLASGRTLREAANTAKGY